MYPAPDYIKDEMTLPYQVTNALSLETAHDIAKYLYRQHRLDIDDRNIHAAITTSNSSPAKAVAKFIHDNHQFSITGQDRTEIGNIIGNKRKQEYAIDVRFTYGVEGSASEYYHPGSCWFMSINYARSLLAYNNGGAIRLYKAGELVGRVWFVPYSGDHLTNGIILFNSYGIDDFQHIYTWGAVVSHVLGKNWCKTTFRKEIENHRDFFLNSETTVFVGEIDRIPERAYIVYFTFRDPGHELYERCMYCDHCEHMFMRNELTETQHPHYMVCHACLERYYRLINRGSHRAEWVGEDYAIILDGGVWYREDPAIISVIANREGYREFVIADTSNITTDVWGDHHFTGRDTYFVCPVTHLIFPIVEGIQTEQYGWMHVNLRNLELFSERDRTYVR